MCGDTHSAYGQLRTQIGARISASLGESDRV